MFQSRDPVRCAVLLVMLIQTVSPTSTTNGSQSQRYAAADAAKHHPRPHPHPHPAAHPAITANANGDMSDPEHRDDVTSRQRREVVQVDDDDDDDDIIMASATARPIREDAWNSSPDEDGDDNGADFTLQDSDLFGQRQNRRRAYYDIFEKIFAGNEVRPPVGWSRDPIRPVELVAASRPEDDADKSAAGRRHFRLLVAGGRLATPDRVWPTSRVTFVRSRQPAEHRGGRARDGEEIWSSRTDNPDSRPGGQESNDVGGNEWKPDSENRFQVVSRSEQMSYGRGMTPGRDMKRPNDKMNAAGSATADDVPARNRWATYFIGKRHQ